MIILKIKGRIVPTECKTVKAAVARYRKVRDDSREGASTFPDGSLTIGRHRYRISYNGSVWNGSSPFNF